MKRITNYKQHSDLIWSIANLLRGPYRPPQYRRVMIPLTVLRRLDCVLEESKDKVIAMHKKLKAQKKYDSETIESIINKKFKLTFHNTSKFTFENLLGDPDKLGQTWETSSRVFRLGQGKFWKSSSLRKRLKSLMRPIAYSRLLRSLHLSISILTDSLQLKWVIYSRISSDASTSRRMKRLAITSLPVR